MSSSDPEPVRRLKTQAGWLNLLNAALAYDIGDADRAESARLEALTLGKELSNRSILGWAHETAVWIEISNSNWHEVIRRAEEALAVVGDGEPTGVAIQVGLERAEAFARLGDGANLEAALSDARLLVDRHKPPANPKNHFAFDHAKFDLREMRVLLVAGEDDRAERTALRLYDELQNEDGTSRHPMRTSEVLASLGLIEARRGNVARAVELVTEAMDIGRQSRLSFHQITSAVAAELARYRNYDDVKALLGRRRRLLESEANRPRP